jgi:hypothetical protein
MKDLSIQMKTSFGNIDEIYNQVGRIILDAEALLEQKSYFCDHGNTAGTEQSKNINTPSKWITPYVSRYYKNERDIKTLLSIGCFFLDINYQVIEPFVAICKFSLKTDEDGEVLSYNYWYIKEAWFNMIENDSLYQKHKLSEGYNYKSGQIYGLKLEDIKNISDVETKIVGKLLEL